MCVQEGGRREGALGNNYHSWGWMEERKRGRNHLLWGCDVLTPSFSHSFLVCSSQTFILTLTFLSFKY